MVMYLFRLGIVSTLLSETLVNSFTCAAAFHVVASQLKDLLGLPTKKRRGMFNFLFVSKTHRTHMWIVGVQHMFLFSDVIRRHFGVAASQQISCDRVHDLLRLVVFE